MLNATFDYEPEDKVLNGQLKLKVPTTLAPYCVIDGLLNEIDNVEVAVAFVLSIKNIYLK